MKSGSLRASSVRSLPMLMLAVLLTSTAIGGGSARTDVLSSLYVRPIAVLIAAVALLGPLARDWAAVRTPGLLLSLFAFAILVQLVPLPPGLWAGLPGHEPFFAGLAPLGLTSGWRPPTLTPDLTLNALLALIPAGAAVVVYATLPEERRGWIVVPLIALAGVSALLGLAQVIGSQTGPLYLYRFVHRGYPVGLFANKNHHAALLAATLPMLRAWTVLPAASVPAARLRGWAAAGFALFIVLMILATGSRAGVLLGIGGLGAAWSVAPPRATGRKLTIAASVSVLALLASAAIIVSGRAASINRLFEVGGPEADLRTRNLPTVLRMLGDFLPWGSGYGSFDPVFRAYEPDALLRPTYFNRAHNDLLELVLNGGIPALLLLAAFLVWLGRRAGRLFGEPWSRSPNRIAPARACLFGILIFLAASLVDYPLRTPLAALAFTLCCCCVAASRRRRARPSDLVAFQGDPR